MPATPHTLRMCRAEFCRLKGCELVIDHVQKRLGAKLGETTGDGRFTLDAVYCLGYCGQSPAVMLDGILHGSVSAQRADSLIDDVLLNH